EPGQQGGREQGVTVLVSFAPADLQLHPVTVNIPKLQAGYLAQPQPCGIGKGDQAMVFSVPDPVQDKGYLFFCKNRGEWFGASGPLDPYRIPGSVEDILKKDLECTNRLVYTRG